MQMDNFSLGSEDFMEDHVSEKLLYCNAHTCVGRDLSGALDSGQKLSFIMFWMKSIAYGLLGQLESYLPNGGNKKQGT